MKSQSGKTIETVDEFVKEKVLPEHQAIVSLIRKMMHELAPKAKEGIAYGIPVWRGNQILAVISPTKKDITFSFSRGAELGDKHGLLKGVGQVSKHVKIKRLADVNKTALRDYIRQAVKLDATRK